METRKGGLRMSLGDTMIELEHLLLHLNNDLLKVRKGNKSAAQRVRVSTLQIEKIGKQFRKESLKAEKSGRLKKPRKKVRKRKRRL